MKLLLNISAAVLLLGAICTPASASSAPSPQDGQEEAFKKERRIFLWDVTISMVGATRDASCPPGTKRTNPDFDFAKSGFPNYNQKKDIFDATRETLINKIMEIQNESTEIIVLPFRNEIVGEFKASATAAGKEQLRKQIMDWADLKPGGTYTATCLQRAVGYFTADRTNTLVLLTDGEPSEDEGPKLLSFVHNWKNYKETRGSGNYLVYVMLTDEANGKIGEEIGKEAEKNEQITVIDPDTPIKDHVFVSIGHNASIYVRDFFDGKVASNGKGAIEVPCNLVEGAAIPVDCVFHFSVEENDFVSIDPTVPVRIVDGKFTVPFVLKKSFEDNLATLPSAYDIMVIATCEKDPDNKLIDIRGSKEIAIALVMKPEPRVKISWSTK